MRSVLLFIMMSVSLIVKAQKDTIFIDNENKKTSRDKAEYFRFEEKKDGLTYVKDYYMNGVLQMTGTYSSFKPPVKEGVFMYYSEDSVLTGEYNYVNNKREGEQKSYFDSGKLMRVSYYSNDELNGELLSYYPNGIVKRREQYENGKMTSGKCYDINGADTTYYAFEIMPVYPGGEEGLFNFIAKNVVYPTEAKSKKISGNVIVTFVVNKDGSVTDVEIRKGVHPLLDEAAMEVVRRMPKWKPGYQDGKPVKVQYNLPVNFRLK